MPDKHEVGGSTPLEPTSRQCRQPVWKVAERDRSKRTDVAKKQQKFRGEGKNKKTREEERKLKQDRYVNLAKAKNT